MRMPMRIHERSDKSNGRRDRRGPGPLFLFRFGRVLVGLPFHDDQLFARIEKFSARSVKLRLAKDAQCARSGSKLNHTFSVTAPAWFITYTDVRRHQRDERLAQPRRRLGTQPGDAPCRCLKRRLQAVDER